MGNESQVRIEWHAQSEAMGVALRLGTQGLNQESRKRPRMARMRNSADGTALGD